MRKFMKEVEKNIWRMYYEPEAQDYAVFICICLAVGCVINCLIKWGR